MADVFVDNPDGPQCFDLRDEINALLERHDEAHVYVKHFFDDEYLDNCSLYMLSATPLTREQVEERFARSEKCLRIKYGEDVPAGN